MAIITKTEIQCDQCGAIFGRPQAMAWLKVVVTKLADIDGKGNTRYVPAIEADLCGGAECTRRLGELLS